MRLNSLAARLIAAATLWAVVALVAAGLILTSLYRQTVENAFDERLDVYLQHADRQPRARRTRPSRSAIPAISANSASSCSIPAGTGRCATPTTRQVVLASGSLFSDTIDVGKGTGTKVENGVTSGALVGPDKQSLRFLTRTVTFEKRPAGDPGRRRRRRRAQRPDRLLRHQRGHHARRLRHRPDRRHPHPDPLGPQAARPRAPRR